MQSRSVALSRGHPRLAVLRPPDPPAEAVRDVYGFMRGSVVIPEGFDLTKPVLDEPLDAELGILHR